MIYIHKQIKISVGKTFLFTVLFDTRVERFLFQMLCNVFHL